MSGQVEEMRSTSVRPREKCRKYWNSEICCIMTHLLLIHDSILPLNTFLTHVASCHTLAPMHNCISSLPTPCYPSLSHLITPSCLTDNLVRQYATSKLLCHQQATILWCQHASVKLLPSSTYINMFEVILSPNNKSSDNIFKLLLIKI